MLGSQSQPVSSKPDQGKCHRHTVIVVCLHVSAVGAAGIDRDSRLFLLTPDAKRGQIRLYRVNPVAFLSADMSDSLYAHRASANGAIAARVSA